MSQDVRVRVPPWLQTFNTMEITRTSKLSGKTHTMDIPVTQEQLNNWEQGMLIQQAMPNLTDSQREFIISGITEYEWHVMMRAIDMDDDEQDPEEDYNSEWDRSSEYDDGDDD